MPCRNRHPRRNRAPGVKMASRDATVYTSVPMANTLPRPRMSPSIPAGRRKIAVERRYAVGIQESMMASMANSVPMRGRARLMLEPAKGLRNVPIVTTRSIPARVELAIAGNGTHAPFSLVRERLSCWYVAIRHQ